MQRSLSQRWADAVTRHWLTVLVLWALAAVGLWTVSPAWNDIAYDGDFEYLPATMTSVAGGHLLDKAFPGERSRSQIVFIVGRGQEKLREGDEIVGLDLLRRLHHRLAEACWQRATIEYGYKSGAIEDAGAAAQWLSLTRESLDKAISLDQRYYLSLIHI